MSNCNGTINQAQNIITNYFASAVGLAVLLHPVTGHPRKIVAVGYPDFQPHRLQRGDAPDCRQVRCVQEP